MFRFLFGVQMIEIAKEFIETMRNMSRARGIDYNFVSTATPYSALLEKYILRRKTLANRNTRRGTLR